MRVDVSITGAEEAGNMIRERARQIQKNLHTAVSKSGLMVKSDARAACPVKSGDLRGSIRARTAGLTSTVAAGMHYAGYVEFGTYKMAAKPYLVPALINNTEKIVGLMQDAVK